MLNKRRNTFKIHLLSGKQSSLPLKTLKPFLYTELKSFLETLFKCMKINIQAELSRDALVLHFLFTNMSNRINIEHRTKLMHAQKLISKLNSLQCG